MIPYFLPKNIADSNLKNIINNVYEIRLREGFEAQVNYLGKIIKLKDKYNKNIICTTADINYILEIITENSLYAFNEQIKRGFISLKDGTRIGLAGTFVIEDGEIITIKSISSLNIRIPRLVKGCSKNVFKHVYNNKKLNNSLIISSVGKGKTTILKELIEKVSKLNMQISVIDERGELSYSKCQNVDYLLYASKYVGFEYSLRSLSPQVIFVDELYDKQDWNFCKHAISCGVKIIASIHANDVLDLKNNPNFTCGIFDRYILLKNEGRAGALQNVYDGDFNLIWIYYAVY